MTDWLAALLVMGVYLVAAFWIGLRAGQGRSRSSVDEYAVGDRNFNLIVMWFLMGGAVFSAFAFLGGPGWAYSRGAPAYYILIYTAIGLLPWYVIGPKISRLGAAGNYYTMGDLLHDRYGSKLLQVVVGIVAVLAFIQYLTLQIKGMAYVFNVMTDGVIPFWAGAGLAYGIVCIYVMTSGVRGAAWSDVLQGAMMFVIAWVVGITLVYTLHDGPADMFRSIAADNPDHLLIGTEGSTMSATRYTTSILVSLAGFLMWPHLFTKSYVTKTRTIRQTVLVYPVFALFLVPILFIGFAAIGVVDPAEVASPDEILPYMITEKLGVSGLVYGLIGAGALAAAMSSSDAITHGASVSFGRDVVQPVHPGIGESALLWTMRLAVLVIGAAAYYLAVFGAQGLVQLLLGAYGSIVQFVPAVYGALFWRRATGLAATVGLVVGIAVNTWFAVFQGGTTPLDIDPGILGLIVNLALFVGLSLAGSPRAERAEKFVNA